jgi:Ca2+-binding EF-hand superfamily protein/chromosome segregation ATPase
MSQKEVLDLKKELEFRRRQILDLEQELKAKDTRLIELDHQARTFEGESSQARQTLADLDQIVARKVSQASDVEITKFRSYVKELKDRNEQLSLELKSVQVQRRTLDEKDSEITFLRGKVKELADQYNMGDAVRDIRVQRDESLQLRREVERLTGQLNEISAQMDEVLSENRVLREMAGVPDNYGFKLDEVKLAEKQKLEEYKARIRRLEQEVEELEKERVDLRYRLRNASTLYGEKGLRFHDLTSEMMELVDQYAQNLREGKTDLPLTDRSRELMKEVEKLKAQLELLQSYGLAGVDSTRPGPGLNEDLLNEIRKENKELRDLLLKLYSGEKPKLTDDGVPNVLQMPPIPIKATDGNFPEGHSYRFGTRLPVTNIWTGDVKRDLAALQLQVIELLELISRRDDDEKVQSFELDDFRVKLREILLVQEELFKAYGTQSEQWRVETKQLNDQYMQVFADLKETRAQLTAYEEMARTIQLNHPESMHSKLVELTKHSALLEVNNIRLSRKYECLQSEEKDIRESFHKIEAEYAEKDVIVQQRIGKLKEWRVSATMQLQFLFKQLRYSIPLDDYEGVSLQLAILRDRQAEWLDREVTLYRRISRFENMDSENLELNEKVRKLEEFAIETDAEFEVVSRRLEALDPQYRLEQASLRRVVMHLKRTHLNPEQAFTIFDRNRDGRVTRGEFRSALESLGLQVGAAELDGLMRSFDNDKDGNIRYTELLRKLERLGVKNRSEAHQVLQTIYTAIRNLNYTLEDVFRIFDKDGNGSISRKELLDSFHNFGIGLTSQQIEKVLKLIDSNADGNIEFYEFKSVFAKELDLEEFRESPVATDWKDQLFIRMNDAIKKYNLNLTEAFAAFDQNKDGRISKSEFAGSFKNMGVTLTASQLDDLWNSVNVDRDGYVSYVEFVKQVKASVTEQEAKQIVLEAEAAVLSAPLEQRERRHVAVLEAREQAALNKAERFQLRMRSLESAYSEAEKQLSSLEAKHFELTNKYQTSVEAVAEFKQQAAGSVSRTEAEKLRQNNELLQKELAEARAAMFTYKNLVQVATDHARALQLTIERKKDEMITFQSALRDLQGSSVDAAALGKVYHQAMVSRWAEATANRKYDSVINETRALRNEAFKLESELMEKEKSLHDSQQVLTEKIASYERLIKSLRLKADHNMSLDKAAEYVATIQEFGDRKSELEVQNRKMRVDLEHIQAEVEDAKLRKQLADDLLHQLKTGSSDELGDKLIELSNKMSEVKLAELQSKRQAAQSKEKEEYLGKLHVQDQETLRILEEEVARWESVMTRKEEQWRRKDDERQKMLLNPRYQAQSDRVDKVEGALVRANMPKELAAKDEQLDSLRLELREARQNLEIKDEQINHLTRIRSEAEAMGSSLTEMPRYNQLTQSQSWALQGETEANKLADAAGKTIATMQDMLDNKNAALERKQEIIDRLKQDMLYIQEQATAEITRLTNELHMQTTGVLGNLRTAIDVTSAKASRPSTSYRPDYEPLLMDKDTRLAQLASNLKATSNAKERLEGLLSQAKGEIDRLQYELRNEQAQNTHVALTRELTKARQQLKTKDSELKGLKTSMEMLKKDLLDAAATNEREATDIRSKVLQEGAENTAVVMQMKKAEQTINALRGQLKRASEEVNKLKEEQIIANERVTKASEEVKRLTDSSFKKQELLEKVMRERDTLKRPPSQTQALPQAALPARKPDVNPKSSSGPVKEVKTKKSEVELDAASDTIMRRFAKILQSKNVQLTSLCTTKKTTGAEFTRALAQANLGLDEEEIRLIVEAGLKYAFVKVSDKVGTEVLRQEPGISLKTLDLIAFKTLGTQPKAAPSARKPSVIREPLVPPRKEETKLDQEKFNRTLAQYKSQLNEQGREIDSVNKQLAHWKDIARTSEAEKTELLNRLALPGRLPQAEVEEGGGRLKDEVFELQQQNYALERKIQVVMHGEIKQLQHDSQREKEDSRRLRLEIMQLKSQVEAAKSSRFKSGDQLREEEIYEKDMLIKKLREDLDSLRTRERELSDSIVRAEQVNMDLRFEKETASLQQSRLQRRIRDLEQLKQMAKPEPSSPDKKVQFMTEQLPPSRAPESNRKSTRELESVIGALKSVIERLTKENEVLKRNTKTTANYQEKLKAEKELKDRIENLQVEISELRSRESINRDLQVKLKKVTEANESLRQDVDREMKLLEEADDKYRALLIQQDIMLKDNERLRRALASA